MKTMKAIINARKGFNLWLKRKTCCKRDVEFLVLFSLHKSRCVPVINAIVTVYHFTRAHPHTHEVRAGPLFGGRTQNLLIKFELECKPLSALIHPYVSIYTLEAGVSSLQWISHFCILSLARNRLFIRCMQWNPLKSQPFPCSSFTNDLHKICFSAS